MFKRKTKNSPIKSFLEFCEEKSKSSPLAVRIVIATEICYALQIPLEAIDTIKNNLETKKNFEKTLDK